MTQRADGILERKRLLAVPNEIVPGESGSVAEQIATTDLLGRDRVVHAEPRDVLPQWCVEIEVASICECAQRRRREALRVGGNREHRQARHRVAGGDVAHPESVGKDELTIDDDGHRDTRDVEAQTLGFDQRSKRGEVDHLVLLRALSIRSRATDCAAMSGVTSSAARARTPPGASPRQP